MSTTSQETFLKGRVGKRLVISIILFSSIITMLLTGVQLFLDYRSDITSIRDNMDAFQHAHLESLGFSVWQIDEQMINTQLNGLLQLPDIEYIEIIVDGKSRWAVGSESSRIQYSRSFPLMYEIFKSEHVELGAVRIIASIDAVYDRLINKAIMILISNGIKTFIVASFTLYLFHLLVTRHLNTLVAYTRKLDTDHLDIPLEFYSEGDAKKTNAEDEFNIVANSINSMRTQLNHSYSDLEDLLQEREGLLEKERNHKLQLEQKVAERTRDLQQSTLELKEKSVSLERSLEELKKTQAHLIETEKIASLGDMVAGVAHEINTPIGICLTTATWQLDTSASISKKLANNTLTQAQLTQYLERITESNTMIERNIHRAATLISNFKMIAVNQVHDVKTRFLLREYLDNIKTTIIPMFKKHNINLELDIPDDLEIFSSAGAFYQVFSNLINNSIIHGFSDSKSGRIYISAVAEGLFLKLTYCDDGAGFTSEITQKIFEPFFTTSRHAGGTGLGMAIVFNTITAQLGGNIKICKSIFESGAGFRITLPIDPSDILEKGNSLNTV